jgi:hypothetical protein
MLFGLAHVATASPQTRSDLGPKAEVAHYERVIQLVGEPKPSRPYQVWLS